MTSPRSEKLQGFVHAQDVLKGTASQHSGVVLTTDQGEKLRLQRIGGNPFADQATSNLVGRRVTLKGYRLGKVFRYEEETKDE